MPLIVIVTSRVRPTGNKWLRLVTQHNCPIGIVQYQPEGFSWYNNTNH